MLFRTFHDNKNTRIPCRYDIPTFEKTNPLFLKFNSEHFARFHHPIKTDMLFPKK